MVVQIPVGRGGEYALVDDGDFDLVSRHRWWLRRAPRGVMYARTQVSDESGSHEKRMHALITGWAEVDHLNLDGLDNRRSNLRPASRSENCANRRKMLRIGTSQYKGLSWDSRTKSWATMLVCQGQRIWLGRFKDELDAARAYDQAAVKYFGEFARLNLATDDRPC